MVTASLPGPLQLAHRHAGGGHQHVHADAEQLAARDLFEEHIASHGHEHADGSPHVHGRVLPRAERVPASPPEHTGPLLAPGSERHVHGVHPFQLAARSATSVETTHLVVGRPAASGARSARRRTRRTPRPRGPPHLLVG
jgi:hypothetical protein